MKRTATRRERFDDKVRINDKTGCHEWFGTVGRPMQHGRFHDGTRQVMAHRWAYEQEHGPIPAGLQIDHLCRNPRCVRVDHLEAVTPRENVLRGDGRAAINARKTHCIRGHEFTPENTGWQNGGRKRFCRTCKNAYLRDRYQRRKAEAV